MKRIMLFSMFCGSLLASYAMAAELYVDQNNPAAADKNPGTEAKPFKTIQAGVDAAKPGDTIWVKAGLYQEPVHITKSGRPGEPITLSAWKDDRVRIGFPPEPLPVQGTWQAIPGSKSFQIKLAKDLPEDVVMILNDKPLLTRLKDIPPPDGKPLWVTYRKADRTVMFNSNGKDPSSLGSLKYSRLGDLTFNLDWVEWWVVRRLEFQWRRAGIAFHNEQLHDRGVFFEHIYIGGIHLAGRTNLIRRCNFHRCGCAITACAPVPPTSSKRILSSSAGRRLRTTSETTAPSRSRAAAQPASKERTWAWSLTTISSPTALAGRDGTPTAWPEAAALSATPSGTRAASTMRRR